MATQWVSVGSRNYLGSWGCCMAALFGPMLGLTWVILGPPWSILGGPEWHLEADLLFGRCDFGVQGGQRLNCQVFYTLKGNQCFEPISGGKEPLESLQRGGLEVLLWV